MLKISDSTRKKLLQVATAKTDNFIDLANIAGLDLGKDFQGSLIYGVDFGDCDLSGVNFDGAIFKKCKVANARIKGARIEGATFNETDIRDAIDFSDLDNKNLAHITIEGPIVSADDELVYISSGGRTPYALPKSEIALAGLDLVQAVERSEKLRAGSASSLLESQEFLIAFASQDSPIYDSKSFIDTDYVGKVLISKIVKIEKDYITVEIDKLISGRIAQQEFGGVIENGTLRVGDEIKVYVERIENATGEAVLSRDKARREESWDKLEVSFTANEKVTGQIFNVVKGGYTVDLDGAVAFLPRSQVDIRPVRDIQPLMNTPQPFQILKMDKRHGNIVVSRRAVLEESRAEQRQELVQNLAEGQVIDGIVKNISEYGAFVDLGGIDGLLHVTDIAWRRVNHPSEVLAIGQTVKVQIVRINHETHRISLGMKQLEADPWDGIEAKYPADSRMTGRVTNVTDYGAFVELEPGIEGLIHVSEMSWTKKNVHPSKLVSTSQEVEVMILEVDPNKRRISLGLKQTLSNPWDSFADMFPAGTVVEGEVKNKTEFGLFVGLEGDIDGMVHLSDLDWNRPGEDVIEEYERGQMIRAQVLDVDTDKERISLGIKQLGNDPFDAASDTVRRGAVVTCEVTVVQDNGVEVKIVDTDVTAFVRRSDLARDRDDQRPDRFSVGDRFDARVTQFDKKTHRVSVSVKALEIAEEKEAVAQYGSSDSGASLGDILAAALRSEDDKEQ